MKGVGDQERKERAREGSGFSSQTFCPVYVPPTYGSENQVRDRWLWESTG